MIGKIHDPTMLSKLDSIVNAKRYYNNILNAKDNDILDKAIHMYATRKRMSVNEMNEFLSQGDVALENIDILNIFNSFKRQLEDRKIELQTILN